MPDMTAEQAFQHLYQLCWNLPANDEHAAHELIDFLRQALTAPRVPVGKVKTIGGYPDESEHTVEWLCKYKDLKDGDLLYAATAPADELAAMREASSLAMSIWKQHYKDISPNFELCDSAVGVITQIDNMVAGLSEKIVERDNELAKLRDYVIKHREAAAQDAVEMVELRDRVKELESYNLGLAMESHKLREALDQIQQIADGYVSEGELPVIVVMVVIQTICRQTRLREGGGQ